MKHPDPMSRLFRLFRALAPIGVAGLVAASALLLQGCLFSNVDKIDEGIVRAETADVYSSTALVALKVATVNRGQEVDILRRESVAGPTYTEEWLQIRLHDDAETSGWIESRHVVSQKIVEEAREAAGTEEELPTIARGRLKVNQRLRLAAGRDSDTAVVLPRGSEFDIIGKAQTTYKPEQKPKPGEDDTEESATETEMEAPETRTDTWYRVRLDEGSIISGGWILAQSVSLQVPDEILHLEGDGRRFVAWQSVGTVMDTKIAQQDPERAKRSHYVTFMKRGGAPEEIDYERIYALFWDPSSHGYYAPYVESDLRGVFPITQRTEGDKTIVTAHVLDANNKPQPIEIEITPNQNGRTIVRRITPQIPGERLSRRR